MRREVTSRVLDGASRQEEQICPAADFSDVRCVPVQAQELLHVKRLREASELLIVPLVKFSGKDQED